MEGSTSRQDPGAKAPPMLHEGDIGSGELAPGQQETNAMIEQIPPLPRDGGSRQDAGQAGPDGQRKDGLNKP